MTLRVLHGMTEAANQAAYAVAGLKKLGGVDAFAARWVESPMWLSVDYSFGFDWTDKRSYPKYAAQMLHFASKASSSFDVFHFHCARSLLPFNADLGVLDRKGKRYYFEYHGTDIRQGSGWSEGNPFSGDLPMYHHRPEIARRARRELRGAAGAIVHDAELALYEPLNSAQIPVFYIPLRVDPEAFSPRPPSVNGCSRPLVVHAPSNPQVKGTRYILEAIEELREEYDFDFKLVTGLEHSQAVELYSRADVVIDQLLIGSYGVLALEAMLLGKPVIAYLRSDVRGTYPDSCPVVSADRDTLKGKLKELLCSASMRNELGYEGRRYAVAHHDYRNVAILLKELYESGNGPTTPGQAYSEMASLHLRRGCKVD